MKRIIAFLVMVILILWGESSFSVGTKKIRIGYVFTPTPALFVAKEKGWFKEEGLDVDLVGVPFGLATQVVVAGEVDMMANCGLTGADFNAQIRGADFRYILLTAMEDGEYGNQSLVARKDLWDKKEIRSLKDLKGKKVAGGGTKGSPAYLSFHLTLESEKIKKEETEDINLQQPRILDAFKAKIIDAAQMYEPWVTYAEREGLGVVIKRLSDVLPEGKIYPITALAVTGKFLRENQEITKKIIKVFQKGFRHYNEAIKDIKKRDEILRTHSKIFNIPYEVLLHSWERKRIYSPLNDGTIDMESILWKQDLLFQLGVINQKLSIEKLFDKNLSLLKSSRPLTR